MIFSGGSAPPKFICEDCVASEKVGEGGPGVVERLNDPKDNMLSELDRFVGFIAPGWVSSLEL